MIFDHIIDLQPLDRDGFELFGYARTRFMQEILPPVKNSFVKSCDFDSCFSPVGRALLFPAQPFLQPDKFPFVFSQNPGIFYFFAIRKGSKTFDSNVNSNMVIIGFNPVSRNVLAGKNGEPPDRRSFDRKSFKSAFGSSVQDDRDVSDFAHKNSFIGNQSESALGISYAFVSVDTFEAGESNVAFLFFDSPEEMFEGISDSFADVLQDLAVDINTTTFAQFIQVKLGKRNPVFFVFIDFCFKKFVIDKTAIRKGLVEPDNLFLRRVYPIPKIHLHSPGLLTLTAI